MGYSLFRTSNFMHPYLNVYGYFKKYTHTELGFNNKTNISAWGNSWLSLTRYKKNIEIKWNENIKQTSISRLHSSNSYGSPGAGVYFQALNEHHYQWAATFMQHTQSGIAIVHKRYF